MFWYNRVGWQKGKNQKKGMVEVARNGFEFWRSMGEQEKQKWQMMMQDTKKKENTIATQQELDCQSSLVRCPFGYCKDKVPMDSMFQHVSSSPHLLRTQTSGNLTISRYMSSHGLEINLQCETSDPIRFIFSDCVFYLQTIVSPDRKFIYNFVQMEGTASDCAKFLVFIKVSSSNPVIPRGAFQTLRPITLDLHCKDDLHAIGDTLIMTERMVVGLLQYDLDKANYYLKMEVKMMESNGTGDQEG